MTSRLIDIALALAAGLLASGAVWVVVRTGLVERL